MNIHSSSTRRRRAPSAALAACFALLNVLASPSAGADELERTFTLEITDAFSPYDWVRYEIKRRGGTHMAVLSKRLSGGYGDLQDLGLLTDDGYRVAATAIDECNLERADPGILAGNGAVYRLTVTDGRSERTYAVAETQMVPGHPVFCAARVILATYQSVAEPVPFRNMFFDVGEYGELMVDSEPAAQVYIDGHATGLFTPAQNIRLTLGQHDVRFVNQAMGIDRSYEVTIEDGHTTRLRVELR